MNLSFDHQRYCIQSSNLEQTVVSCYVGLVRRHLSVSNETQLIQIKGKSSLKE